MLQKHIALSLGLAMATVSAVAAPGWDLAPDYVTIANPNGAWSYGAVTTSPAYAFSTLAWNPATNSYGVAQVGNTFIYKNVSGSSDYGIGNGKVSLESDWGNAAVRWTAPAAGTYSFTVAVGGSTVSQLNGYGNNFASEAGVKVNGLDEPATSYVATSTSKLKQWSFTVALAPGDMVDTFVLNLGFANGGNTQTDISVSAVPEPASALLLGLGIGALALRRHRKAASAASA